MIQDNIDKDHLESVLKNYLFSSTIGSLDRIDFIGITKAEFLDGNKDKIKVTYETERTSEMQMIGENNKSQNTVIVENYFCVSTYYEKKPVKKNIDFFE